VGEVAYRITLWGVGTCQKGLLMTRQRVKLGMGIVQTKLAVPVKNWENQNEFLAELIARSTASCFISNSVDFSMASEASE
jgi:organic hydroperoxide reductase OsmC/OhrA